MKKADAAKGALWNALFTFINKLILPFVGIYLAGKIGTEEMGYFYVVSALYAILELFRDGGVATTFIADKELTERKEAVYRSITTGTGLFMGMILAFGCSLIANAMGSPKLSTALVICGISMAISGLGTVPVNSLVKSNKFREIGTYDTIANLIGYAVAVVLVVLKTGYMALVWQILTRVVVYTLLCVRAAPLKWFAFSKTEVKQIFKHSVSNMGSNLAYTIYTMADNILMKQWFGARQLGLYGTAFNLANKPTDLIAGPINRSLAVTLNKRPVEEYGDILARALGIVLVITLPLFAFLEFNTHSLIEILYPDEFMGSVPLLKILVAYMFARSIGTVYAASFPNAGKPHLNAIPWFFAYIFVAAMVYSRWGRFTATEFVVFLTVGAMLVYCSYVCIAVYLFPVSKVRRMALLKLLGVSSVTAALVFGVSVLPIGALEKVALGLLAGVLGQAVLVGWVLTKKVTSAFSKSGLRAMFDAI
jgi:O-antigen/teichoic acid export membrane protein